QKVAVGQMLASAGLGEMLRALSARPKRRRELRTIVSRNRPGSSSNLRFGRWGGGRSPGARSTNGARRERYMRRRRGTAAGPAKRNRHPRDDAAWSGTARGWRLGSWGDRKHPPRSHCVRLRGGHSLERDHVHRPVAVEVAGQALLVVEAEVIVPLPAGPGEGVGGGERDVHVAVAAAIEGHQVGPA